MDVRLVGVDLPGRTFDDRRRPDGLLYENVHVGVQRRRDVVELVPGDAPRATWHLTIDTRRNDGELDFRGPDVQGKRLVGTVTLTDGGGCPRCAAVWPPDVAWTVG